MYKILALKKMFFFCFFLTEPEKPRTGGGGLNGKCPVSKLFLYLDLAMTKEVRPEEHRVLTGR